MKQGIAFTAAAGMAAAFLFALLPLPGRPIALPQASSPERTAVGAFHVHTQRSDGSGSVEEVAAAAARAGLQFIILTDHGDGTRASEPPQYLSGVLVIDAVEISTQAGHYIAIGLPQAPYPLQGDARDVVEDVRRLGGFGIVAHPDSARHSLRWYDWDARFDAMEWLNADSEWRDESAPRLARALVQYPFRAVETVAALLDRPDVTLSRWDALTTRRPVVALAGADAHARTGWQEEDARGYRSGWFLNMPSYEVSFRTFALRVAVERPIGTSAIADAAQIIGALKAGKVYSAIDAVASPSSLEFSATSENRVARQGESLDSTGPISFVARSAGSTNGTIVLRRDGRIVTERQLPELTIESSEYGAYRVEVYLPGASGSPPVPWIVSNPIYVQPAGWGAALPTAQPDASEAWSIQGGPWHVEKDGASTARVVQAEPPAGPVEFHYTLASGERAGQYAALAISVGNALTDRTQLAFRAHASRPMRVSVQARRPSSGERWQRSIYLDTEPRAVTIPFRDFRAVGDSIARFDPRLIDTLLFVADTTHNNPGTTGTFSIGDLGVER